MKSSPLTFSCLRVLQFAILLAIIFVAEFVIAITVLALSGKATEAVKDLMAEKVITGYRDDINTQNLVDWVQETVSHSCQNLHICTHLAAL